MALGLTVVVKWQLRQYTWFWVAMSISAAVHVAVVFSVHWTDKWVPAPENAAIATVDFILMLVLLDAVGRLTKTRRRKIDSDRIVV